jgi:glycosyltransferase involved in cell wall biosynthesis
MEKIILRSANFANFAILIPCLNEGERLIKTVTELETEYGDKFDLILIDGGSSDGSIEKILIMPLKILQSVLITNIGKGLSSDLYAGFNEVVDKYEYILTLDGNNKDDTRNIKNIFYFAQSNRMDFVQGSRFKPGGISRNLPQDRYLGIKLFISPIVSIASRRIITDPSNQFRVISKKSVKLLIKIDINKFKRYDYFFFIPIKLSRSGFKISEFPVSRSYPNNGTIPSHIKKSRYLMLGIDLLKVVIKFKRY